MLTQELQGVLKKNSGKSMKICVDETKKMESDQKALNSGRKKAQIQGQSEKNTQECLAAREQIA